MKFIHLSDLHLGKRVNEFSMIEEQEYILAQIINIIDKEKPQAVLLAGDIYDKSVPSAEAVQLFDDFLCKLAKRKLEVFVISGNHDSAERIAFGSRIMDNSGIHMSPVYNGNVCPISLKDDFGTVDFYMLPFIKPSHVRRFYPDEEITTYTDAVRCAVDNMNINTNNRNIIITHQFVTGASTCESEEISVGGTDNVDVSVFDKFDYVALGHIHGPQNIGSPKVRYCGTPLKYSFSEVKHKKSVTVAELTEKDNLFLKTVYLTPKNDMREIKGTYFEITSKENYKNTKTDDYMHITLTDEEDIPDAIGKLRVIYPKLMKLDYDNKRTRSNTIIDSVRNIEEKSPLELFGEFYEKQNNQPMSDEQKSFVQELIEKIWEEI
ncbi:MAG: exonuclease SbcCD subunit D [Acutalibacteraceae bacterium]|nr:exonuclease SbcCD subunit D [Acutalibacteraceae bacterium]